MLLLLRLGTAACRYVTVFSGSPSTRPSNRTASSPGSRRGKGHRHATCRRSGNDSNNTASRRAVNRCNVICGNSRSDTDAGIRRHNTTVVGNILRNSCLCSRRKRQCLRNPSTNRVILIRRQRHSSQNTNNRHHDHQFDQGETLLNLFHVNLLEGNRRKNRLPCFIQIPCQPAPRRLPVPVPIPNPFQFSQLASPCSEQVGHRARPPRARVTIFGTSNRPNAAAPRPKPVSSGRLPQPSICSGRRKASA